MKKKLAIIICIFSFGIIAWVLYSQKTAKLVSVVLDKEIERTESERDSGMPAVKKDVQLSEVQNSDDFTQYLNSLPTAEDFKTLTYDEVHHTPEIIKNAGALVGRIHSEAQANTSKRASAMSFFKSCAEDEQVIPAIRAVCLKKVYKLIPEWKIPVILSEEKISKEVADLAMKIP